METRRDFLGGLCAAGAGLLAGGCEIEDVARLVDDARVVARLGVIAYPEVESGRKQPMLEKVFCYYLQEGVDAVVIPAGATKNGRADQMAALQDSWNRVFAGTETRLVTEEGRTEVHGFPFRVMRRAPFDRCGVVTFHAADKYALTDELRFHDRTYRSLCAGSMSGVKVQNGYEHLNRESPEDVAPAVQGLLVGAYSDKILVRRLDFTQRRPVEGLKPHGIYAEDVAEEIELALDGSSPKVKEAAPEFWPDTTLRLTPGYLGGKRVLTVSWPNVLKRFTGARAHSYDVCAYAVASDGTRSAVPFIRKRVLSGKFMLSESRDTGPVSCRFGVSDEAGFKVVVSVTPIGYRGDLGRPLFSAPIET